MKERLNLTAEEIELALRASEFTSWFEEFGIPDQDIENQLEEILERLGFKGEEY